MPEKTKAEIRQKFADESYPIHVIGRHVEVTDAMKNYAIDKLSKFDKFGGRVVDATITMDIQKTVHSVDFIVNVNNTKIKVSGHSDNMYVSIDLAIKHLKSKLSRYLSRLHDHHAKGAREIETNINVLEQINDQIEEENFHHAEQELRPHKVVSKENYPLKILTQAEAIMKMELSEDPFMLYLSEEERKLKVIYRRADRQYGIIEPEK